MNSSEKTVIKQDLYVGASDFNGRIKLTLELCKRFADTIKTTVDLKPFTGAYWEVSIVGTMKEFDRYGFECGGQIEDELRKYDIPESAKRIIELWDRWHLNDLNAGTKWQQACLDVFMPFDYDYDIACAKLEDNRLYSDRGYKYGHAWLLEIVPTVVLVELCELFGVDQDRTSLVIVTTE